MKTLPWLLLMSMLFACSKSSPQPKPSAGDKQDPAHARLEGAAAQLPVQVGRWTRAATSRRVTAETIFDYMDGGGELYLAYRFEHLDVVDYKAPDASLGTILVEVYSMKTPEDAFGLLSNDWGGEAVSLLGAPTLQQSAAVPPHRALYGAGLLRMSSGPVFVRILASRESPDARAATLQIGRSLATPASAGPAAPPTIIAAIARAGGASGRVRADRTCFFRSYLVLNSQYFLASQDILGLGLDVDAATSELRPAAAGERAVRVIAIRYPSSERATSGLETFIAAYLPAGGAHRGAVSRAGSARVEHGWVAWLQKGRNVAIALDAPTSASASQATASLLSAMPAASGDK